MNSRISGALRNQIRFARWRQDHRAHQHAGDVVHAGDAAARLDPQNPNLQVQSATDPDRSWSDPIQEGLPHELAPSRTALGGHTGGFHRESCDGS